ncbi:MAG: hypothetical protein JWP57_1292 [Spirosoma sp.]|nr:hypothetical protein [Spirosoma sp.]
MVLLLTAFDKKAQFRQFTCHINTLEGALDTLSAITATGDILMEAHLLDEGKWTMLPVAVFDGQMLTIPLLDLQRQWQQVLVEPLASTPVDHDPFLMKLTHSHIQRYQTRSAVLMGFIKQAKQQRQQVLMTTRGRCQARLLHRLDQRISLYQHQLDRLLQQQQHASDRLTKWPIKPPRELID